MKKLIILAALIAGGIYYYKTLPGPEGVYFKENQDKDYIELTVDGRFELYERGRSYSGSYEIENRIAEANVLNLRLDDGRAVAGTISSDIIIDNEKQKWFREEVE